MKNKILVVILGALSLLLISTSGVAQCAEGATQCAGKTVQTCTGGVWVDTDWCTHCCIGGACNDDTKHHSGCHSGDVYWYDACNNRHNKKDNCKWWENCVAASCVPKGNGSEFSFNLGVNHSYPGSGIPIEPTSSDWSDSTPVNFTFYLNAAQLEDQGQPGCDLNGDPTWQMGGHEYCGFYVPETVVAGFYQLRAEWDLLAVHHVKTIDPLFEIKVPAEWYNTRSAHAWFTVAGPTYTEDFTLPYVLSGGTYYTCPGNTFQVENIAGVLMECSDSWTSVRAPRLMTWTYCPINTRQGTAQNNWCSGVCNFVTRNTLFNVADKGYCPLNSYVSRGTTANFNAFTFNIAGLYTLILDLQHAYSDSPWYICPNIGGLCAVGTMSGAGRHHGWEYLETYKIRVICADDINATFRNVSIASAQEISPGNFTIEPNRTAEILKRDFTVTWEVENTGIVDATIKSYSLVCSPGVTCSGITPTPLNIGENSTVLVHTNIQMSVTKEEQQVNLIITYNDGYGLNCIPDKTISKTVAVRWLDTVGPYVDVRIIWDNGSGVVYGGMHDTANKTVNITIWDHFFINESSITIIVNGSTFGNKPVYHVFSLNDKRSNCTNKSELGYPWHISCQYDEKEIKPGPMQVSASARDILFHNLGEDSEAFIYAVKREIKGMCYRWNAISLPLLPIDSLGNPNVNVTTTPVLQGLPYDRLSRHKVADIFDSFAPEIPLVISQSLNELAVGKGYFIFINDTSRTPGGPLGCINKSYYGIPDLSNPQLAMNSTGWYFFGIQSNSPLLNCTINDALLANGITSSDYLTIYYYDKHHSPPYGEFTHYYHGDPTSTFHRFNMSRGYWINYNGSGDTLPLY